VKGKRDLGKIYSLVEGHDATGRLAASAPPAGQKSSARDHARHTVHFCSIHTGRMAEHPDREKQTYATVEDYLAAAPYDVEPRLHEMRQVVREALPDAQETISHNIPAYRQHGVVVVQLAGHAEHTSLNFFPTAGAFAQFAAELTPYATSKSGIRFPLDEPLPVELIARIATFRLAEAAEFAARKKSGR